jgi:hypothetical protein
MMTTQWAAKFGTRFAVPVPALLLALASRSARADSPRLGSVAAWVARRSSSSGEVAGVAPRLARTSCLSLFA